MKKPQKSFWTLFTMLFIVGLCIAGVIFLWEVFQEISRGDRYEYDDFYPLSFERSTPAPLNVQRNDDLTDLVSDYKKGHISIMDLSTITPFMWDRVHIFSDFPDFVDYRDIDRILGKSWSNVDSCDYAVRTTRYRNTSDNKYAIFLFIYENTIVYCLLYKHTPEARVYVNSTDIKTGIPRENALFIIDDEGIIRPGEK